MQPSMKTFLLAIILSLIHAATMAQGELTITIRNIRKIKGSMLVGLFDNETAFPKVPIIGKVISVTADSLTITFNDLSAGTYAISVVHDENNNGKLDTNFLGIPKEGFAFGNNAMGTFGPPSFKNAQISIIKNPVKQILLLKYL